MNKGNMDTIRQKKTYQDDKWKLQNPLSPYSQSGDLQFIPLKLDIFFFFPTRKLTGCGGIGHPVED